MCQNLLRLSSSWGCVQAFVLTLTILCLPLVSAFRPAINLLDAFKIPGNHSRTDIILAEGMEPHQTAFRLDEPQRNLSAPKATVSRAIDLLAQSPDFTISTILRQRKDNLGTIISISSGNNRYLELESSGRSKEIRFVYTPMDAKNSPILHTESFAYNLADDKWHKVSLSVSGPEIELLVDCQSIHRRMAEYLPDRNLSASEMHLFIGQRDNRNQLNQLKGYIQDAYIVSGPNGYLKQCPNLKSHCPTCGQFNHFEESITVLIEEIDELKKRLAAQENRIVSLEECDCRKSCKTSNGTWIEDMERWEENCETCICESGKIKCNKKICNETMCKNPQYTPDDKCCPKCLKTCLDNNHNAVEHGEYSTTNCIKCMCNNGVLACEKMNCPQLSCPPEKQIQETSQCCKYCSGSLDNKQSIDENIINISSLR